MKKHILSRLLSKWISITLLIFTFFDSYSQKFERVEEDIAISSKTNVRDFLILENGSQYLTTLHKILKRDGYNLANTLFDTLAFGSGYRKFLFQNDTAWCSTSRGSILSKNFLASEGKVKIEEHRADNELKKAEDVDLLDFVVQNDYITAVSLNYLFRIKRGKSFERKRIEMSKAKCLIKTSNQEVFLGTSNQNESKLFKVSFGSCNVIANFESNINFLFEFSDSLWICTSKGLYKSLAAKLNQFDLVNGTESYDIRHIDLDNENNLWIASSTVLKYDRKKFKIDTYKIGSIASNKIQFDSPKKRIYVGSSGSGLYYYQLEDIKLDSMKLCCSDTSFTKKIENGIVIQRIKDGKILQNDSILFSREYEIENLLFVANSYETFIHSETKADSLINEVFKRYVLLSKVYPNIKIKIVGHTSKVQDSKQSFNKELSKARAEKVSTMLQKKGVYKNKVSAEGKGFSDIKYKPESDSRNQRVEFIFENPK